MPHPHLPVLWICGSAAAGKSATAWALFEHALNDRNRLAYLDIDQVGMLYPDSEEDPNGYQLKCDALNGLIANYRAAGAQALIVSGVLDPAESREFADRFDHADVTFCLLDTGEAALRERILARGWDQEDADEAVTEAATLRAAPFIDEVIDTRGMTVVEVADRVRGLLVTIEPESRPMSLPPSSATADLLVVTGVRAVGTSTVGFGLARNRWGSNKITGFVDLDQINFLPATVGAESSAVGIANLATLHELFASRGASMLIASAHLKDESDHRLVRGAFPNARAMTIVRLRADEDTLKEHVRDRLGGSAARLAGDDLASAPIGHQTAVVAQALVEQEALDQKEDEDLLVDVSHRTVDDVLTEISSST